MRERDMVTEKGFPSLSNAGNDWGWAEAKAGGQKHNSGFLLG